MSYFLISGSAEHEWAVIKFFAAATFSRWGFAHKSHLCSKVPSF